MAQKLLFGIVLWILCGRSASLFNARSSFGDISNGHELLSVDHATGDAVKTLGSLQEPPVTSTEHESWGSKMQQAFMSFVFGIVAITFSVPILWVNERRNARMQSLISRSRGDVQTVSSKKVSESNRGTLVHLSDASTHACEAVSSKCFSDVTLKTGCVRLQTQVEVYQWVESKETKETKDNVGGGTTKKTTYTYDQKWVYHTVNSNEFGNKSKEYHNTSPNGLSVGTEVVECGRVEYGEGFLVPGGLVSQLGNFKNAHSLLGESVHANKVAFVKGDDWYYYPKQRGQPSVGDARANFQYVSEGPATILALQAEDLNDGSRDSFKPYRLFFRGLCGMREDEEKRRALKEADKSAAELADEDKCTAGPLGCLCCACNLVTMCASGMMAPEIFHIFTGEQSQFECFKSIESQSTMMTWLIRLGGWVLMFVGSYCLFAPLQTFADIIPFLGPYLSSFIGFVVFIACFLFTVALSSLIICLAYLAYHPLMALMYAVLFGAVAAMATYAIPAMQAKAKAM